MLQCPSCGCSLELALTIVDEGTSLAARATPAAPTPPTTTVQFILAGRPYGLSREDISNVARGLTPRTILKYYVMLLDATNQEQRFPIKQVVRQALRAKYGEHYVEKNFTAHRARDVLRRLGYDVKEAR